MDSRTLEILFERVYMQERIARQEKTEAASVRCQILLDLLEELDLVETYADWQEETA